VSQVRQLLTDEADGAALTVTNKRLEPPMVRIPGVFVPLLVWVRMQLLLAYNLPGQRSVPLEICDDCGSIARRAGAAAGVCKWPTHDPRSRRFARVGDIAEHQKCGAALHCHGGDRPGPARGHDEQGRPPARRQLFQV
jgi:hypothetical protein